MVSLMTYTNKILAHIGKQVVKQHPDIAIGILESVKKPLSTDLEKIPSYFNIYCLHAGIDPQELKGPVYKSSLTELKKVFISSMMNIYDGHRGVNKALSLTLDQQTSYTSRLVKEVDFRYKKDALFIQKVNNILNKIITQI